MPLFARNHLCLIYNMDNSFVNPLVYYLHSKQGVDGNIAYSLFSVQYNKQRADHKQNLKKPVRVRIRSIKTPLYPNNTRKRYDIPGKTPLSLSLSAVLRIFQKFRGHTLLLLFL